jgi:hypothetical protein
MISLRVVARISARFGATVLAATIVGTYLLLGFSAQAPDVQTVVRVADILAMFATILSSSGIPVGDFITSETGLVPYAVFTLEGTIVGFATASRWRATTPSKGATSGIDSNDDKRKGLSAMPGCFPRSSLTPRADDEQGEILIRRAAPLSLSWRRIADGENFERKRPCRRQTAIPIRHVSRLMGH